MVALQALCIALGAAIALATCGLQEKSIDCLANGPSILPQADARSLVGDVRLRETYARNVSQADAPGASPESGYPKVTPMGAISGLVASCVIVACLALYLHGDLPKRLSSMQAFLAVHACACAAVYVCDVAHLIPIVTKHVGTGVDHLLFVISIILCLVVIFGLKNVKPRTAKLCVSTGDVALSPATSEPIELVVNADGESADSASPDGIAHCSLTLLAKQRDDLPISADNTPALLLQATAEHAGSSHADSKNCPAAHMPTPQAPSVSLPTEFFPIPQSLEYKGWMMLVFLGYHYWDVKAAYNPIRVCVAAYLFLTGYGNFMSLCSNEKRPSVHKLCTSIVRINLLPTLVMCVTRKAWVLYYIAPLHTLCTLIVYAYFWFSAWIGVRASGRKNGTSMSHDDNEGNKSTTSPAQQTPRVVIAKLSVLLVVLVAIFEVPGLAGIVFFVANPLLTYCGGLNEFIFRAKLDAYASWAGMAFAAAVPHIMTYLVGVQEDRIPTPVQGQLTFCSRISPTAITQSPPYVGILTTTFPRVRNGGLAMASVMLIHAWVTFPMTKGLYNTVHRFTAWAPIAAFLILRNLTPGLRSLFSPALATVGAMSLELYVLQFHVWMANNAKTLVVMLPDMRELSFLLQTSLFFLISHMCSISTRTVLRFLDGNAAAAYASAGCILALIALINSQGSACATFGG